MKCKFKKYLKNAKILYFSSNQELLNSKKKHGCTFIFALKTILVPIKNPQN